MDRISKLHTVFIRDPLRKIHVFNTTAVMRDIDRLNTIIAPCDACEAITWLHGVKSSMGTFANLLLCKHIPDTAHHHCKRLCLLRRNHI